MYEKMGIHKGNRKEGRERGEGEGREGGRRNTGRRREGEKGKKGGGREGGRKEKRRKGKRRNEVKLEQPLARSLILEAAVRQSLHKEGETGAGFQDFRFV